VICLDEVQDPHNLGAVCRVAECAGAAGVVIPERRAAAVTPAVCRSSAGAVEHLPVARVRNVTEFLTHAKRSGAWVYGAHGRGRGSI
jgi:23S rRNA (guanosine2251-2'-O)-methyltransferase